MENTKKRFAKQTPELKFSPSRTVPGQSLLPSELIKRHLAGTLPDIDLTPINEYHYDETGEQVAERLPIEFHEFHKMAVALQNRRKEAVNKLRAEKAQKFRDEVIEEYKKTLLPKEATPDQPHAKQPD